ncbi:UNVERIFIED_CONTAM: Actin-depolymerizing factor [Sesamum angustifolium]|uniref:Actin-depolymerizing factor n=1 Tax=Sesamum angustifolium TaxID=2727405 RepID=A0AAW2KG46_9LAMI
MLNYLFLCSDLLQINVVSGIGVADYNKSAFLELKRKRVHRYLIFKISEKKNEVLVKKTGGPARIMMISLNPYRGMIANMQAPEISRTRAKMLYAASKDRFKSELDGVHYDIQTTDSTEMDLEVIRKRAS